jgi:hypothetical protein
MDCPADAHYFGPDLCIIAHDPKLHDSSFRGINFFGDGPLCAERLQIWIDMDAHTMVMECSSFTGNGFKTLLKDRR